MLTKDTLIRLFIKFCFLFPDILNSAYNYITFKKIKPQLTHLHVTYDFIVNLKLGGYCLTQ